MKRGTLILLFVLTTLIGFSQKKISQYDRITTVNDSSLYDVSEWTGVNTYSTKAIKHHNLRDAINQGDTAFLRTTGATYQHDSLYIDKILCGEQMEFITENGLSIKETTNNRTLLTLTDGGDFSISNTTNGYNPYHLYKNDTVFRLSTFNQVFTGNFFESKYDGSQYNYNTKLGFTNYSLSPNGDFIYRNSLVDTSFRVTNGKIYIPMTQDNDNNLDSVFVYEPSTGQMKLRDASTIGSAPSLTSTRIAFGSGSNTITESADLTWNNTTKIFNANGNVRSTKTAGGNGFEIYGGSLATNPTSLTIDANGTTAFLKVNGVTHISYGGGGITTHGYIFPDANGTRAIGAPTFAFSAIHGTSFRSPSGLDRTWDIVRTTVSDGNSLSIKAGDALLNGTNKLGGNLKLYSGTGTGSGGGDIKFYTSTPSSSGTVDNTPTEKATLFGNGNFSLGVNGVAKLNITCSASDGSSEGLSVYNLAGTKNFSVKDNGNTTIGKILHITPQTSTEASAITPSDGMVIYVSDTNGTFTSVGIWARENGVWVKL